MSQLKNLEIEDFRPLISEPFEIGRDAVLGNLELIEVTAPERAHANAGNFSLLFRAVSDHGYSHAH